jgi:ketosteroid isomerase-like protein
MAAMEEKAEVVHRAYDLMNRRDADGLVELCADDFVMDMSERVFNPDTYRGPEGIRRFLDDVDEAWQSYQWEVEEALVAGDAVVAMLHCRGQSREGGPGVDWHVAWVWNLQGATPASLRFYRDRERALQGAGLAE